MRPPFRETGRIEEGFRKEKPHEKDRQGQDRTRRQGAERRAGGQASALPLVSFRGAARERNAVCPAGGRLFPFLRLRFSQSDERLLLSLAGGALRPPGRRGSAGHARV